MSERALAWEYIRAIFKDWVGWMSGGGGLLLTIGAQFMSDLASPGWFWGVGTAACLFACYRAWRQERVRLQARLLMHAEVEESRTGHFRLVLENMSQGETITGCGVVLDNPDPVIDHWPFALHCSGGPPVPHYETKIALRPGEKRKFDLCHFDGKRVLMGCTSRDDIVLKPGDTYRLTIRAFGDNVPAESRVYELNWSNPAAAPKIVPVTIPSPPATQP